MKNIELNNIFDDVPPEKENDSLFVEQVRQAQTDWKAAKLPLYKDLAQSVDILAPQLNSITLSNFPKYVPKEVIDRITETHPAPLVSVGVLPDHRIYQEPSSTETLGIFCEKLNLTESEILAVYEGMNLLLEIGNDKLANDVLRNVAKIEDKTEMRLPFIEHAEKLAEVLLTADFRTNLNIDKAYQQLLSILGSREVLERFLQTLVITMLKHDQEILSDWLKPFGYTTTDVALELGKSNAYKKPPGHTIKDKGMLQGNTITQKLYKTGVSIIMRTRDVFSMGGAIIPYYPGVITLPLFTSILNLGYHFPSSTKKGMFRLLPLYELIHEQCHYLSSDETGIGFMRYQKTTHFSEIQDSLQTESS